MNKQRDKLFDQGAQLITEKMVKQIKYYGLPQQDYEVTDTDQGKMIEEIRKKRITCETCLMKDRKILPHGQIKNPKDLCSNHQIKLNLSNDQDPHKRHRSKTPQKQQQQKKQLSYFKLQQYNYHPEQELKDDRLREDNIQLLEKVVKLIQEKDQMMPDIRQLIENLTLCLRKNDQILKNLVSSAKDPDESLKQIEDNMKLIPYAVAILSDNYFEEDLVDLNTTNKTINLLKSQERLIQLLRKQNQRTERLFNSLRLIQTQDKTLVTQLLNLKSEVERLDSLVSEMTHQMDSQKNDLNQLNNIFDHVLKAIKKYNLIFPISCLSNIINTRYFIQDLENLSQALGDYKDFQSLLRDFSSLKKIKDELSRSNQTIDKLQKELISQSLQDNKIDDPTINKMIQELSLIILSKDASYILSEQTKKQIREIFNQNVIEMVDNYEKQIQSLRDKPNRQTLLPQQSIYGEMHQNQEQEETMMMLLLQASTIENSLKQRQCFCQ